MADQQILISLPEEILRLMQQRIDAGEYGSISALIVSRLIGTSSPESFDAAPPEEEGVELEAELRESIRLFQEEAEPFNEMLTLEQMKAVLDQEIDQMRDAA